MSRSTRAACRGALAVFLAALLHLAGCRPPGGGHEAGGGGDPPLESRIIHTASFEHFHEHPPLVAGEPSRFAAHATETREWKPVGEGTLAVLAVREGKVAARSEPVPPSRPGVFAPVLTVPAPGPVELRVRLEMKGLVEEASLGEARVHASKGEAALELRRQKGEADAAEGAAPAIAFLKEQQWRIGLRTEPAAHRALVETLRLPGRLAPRPEGRALASAPASGRYLPPPEGLPRLAARVEAGASLGAIALVLGGAEGTQLVASRTELAVKEIEVETEVARARARLERAEKLRARAERLRAREALSERELEEARFQADLAAADLAAAEKLRGPYEEVRAREGSFARLEVPLPSPLAGTVVRAEAVPGEYVEAGRVLFEVVDLERLWVEAEVPEADLSRLPRQPRASYAPASTPGAGEPRPASFVALAPRLDPQARSARLIYACEPGDPSLPLGAAVDLLVEVGAAQEALSVPESAVVEEDLRPVVFVQSGGESFERRTVELGLRAGGRVQVLSGLEAGERVVTRGAYAVRLQSLSASIPEHHH